MDDAAKSPVDHPHFTRLSTSRLSVRNWRQRQFRLATSEAESYHAENMNNDISIEEARTALKARRISRSKYSRALIGAIDDDDRELVELLLCAGANVNAANQYGSTPLITAAWQGKEEYVQRLLAVPGIDVNRQIAGEKTTALIAAARRGWTNCTQLLLAAPEIDLDTTEQLGWSRLHLAASCGMTAWTQTLLAAGAEPNQQNEDGDTPLGLAAEKGHLNCMRLLLEAPGININHPDNEGETPLMKAAYYNQPEAIKLLLATPGIDINATNQSGDNAFHLAIFGENPECARMLMEAPGFDLARSCTEGRTPLHLAAASGLVQWLRQLLSKSPDINAQDDMGRTPLYHAAFYHQAACMQLLLEAPGVDVNLPSTGDGNTPLHEAAQDDGDAECLRLLLAAPGIKVNEMDADGASPLHLAVEYGSVESVRLLLAAPGIQVNARNKDDATPLQLALEAPVSDIFTQLLAHPEIDVNARNADGVTALHIAALNDFSDCVRLLLAAPGINVNTWDNEGDTPLDYARYNRKSTSESLIIQAGGREKTLLPPR